MHMERPQEHATRLTEKSPRTAGMLAFLVGVAMLSTNYLYITQRGEFFGSLFILGLPLALTGPWMVIAGRSSVNGGHQPLWWKFGTYTLFGFGTLGGLFLAITLRK